ncbi:GGDEF domain-containing protein [Desulfovibrio sp. XJ01]|nr:GGDEF domain-containing protein [Nitratidesulfovibrio liaohensis]
MLDKNRMHRCMNALLANGLQDDADPETARVTGVANLFYGVTALFSAIMAVLDFMQDQNTLALLLLAMLALALFGLFWVGRTGRHALPSTALVLALFSLSLYMVSHGGVEGSGFVWLFIFPPVVMLTFGLSIGILLMAALLLGVGAILFLPGDPFLYADYSQAFRIRYMVALLCCGIFAGLAEYTRRHTQRLLILLTQQLAESARTDELTGLANRRALCERLEYEQVRARRTGRSLSIAICDIDHFKSVNDCYGHQCGDQVLQSVAGLLHDNLRHQDTICRWGGEEFLLLLPETDEAGAARLAEKLRGLVEASEYSYHGIPVSVTLSFGVHTCGPEGDIDYHIRKADQKLYLAKEQGRNRVFAGEVPDIFLPEGLMLDEEEA